MLETYSPSGSENELSALLLNELEANGLRARIDGVGNVIGEAGQEGPRILLCGHMDTVPGLIPVVEKDGFIYGRGAVDAKSSLAAMILGCKLAKQKASFPFRATVAGVVEEETSSEGMKEVISSKSSYDLAVFGEPSGTSNIIIGYKGSLHLQITCLAPGGHSSSPWLAKNTLEEAFEFWNHLKQVLLENDLASKFSALTGCLTDARTSPGGNSIPSRTTLEVDLRTPPGIDPGGIVRRVEEFKERYVGDKRGLQFTILFGGETKPYLGGHDTLGVRAFRYAIRRVVGGEVLLVRKTGTSDMNLLSEVYRLPMVAYGPGDSSLDHTDQERIHLSDYLKSIDVYATAIERFAALAAQPLAVVNP